MASSEKRMKINICIWIMFLFLSTVNCKGQNIGNKNVITEKTMTIKGMDSLTGWIVHVAQDSSNLQFYKSSGYNLYYYENGDIGTLLKVNKNGNLMFIKNIYFKEDFNITLELNSAFDISNIEYASDTIFVDTMRKTSYYSELDSVEFELPPGLSIDRLDYNIIQEKSCYQIDKGKISRIECKSHLVEKVFGIKP